MFESRHLIRFNDVDGAGLVYFPRFLHLCHATMEDFFNARGPVPYAELVGTRKLGFPTVHAEVDWSAPLRMGDTARVAMAVTALGRSSITFRHVVTRLEDGVSCCTARLVTVHTDLVAMKPVPLGEELRAVLESVRADP